MPTKLFRGLRALVFCAVPLFAGTALAQRTINVAPGTAYPTIQSGIDAAANGDTVLVAPGTYLEGIDFKGKAITVTSSGGAAVTTITSNDKKTPSVTFQTGESRASVLSNFTVTGGSQYYTNLMGGIYVGRAGPTILNNVITNTLCYGINSQDSSPLIQGNEISYVQAQPFQCTFASGAGIWISGRQNGMAPIISGNTIENNTQSGLEDAGGNGGAGVAVWGGTPVILNNIIRNNATGRYSSPAGGGEGGGIFFEAGGAGLVAGNLIYGNTSNLDGGGIAFGGFLASAPQETVINNTIVDNAVVPVSTYSQTVTGGQQISFGAGQGSHVTFANNIVSGSTTGNSVTCYDTAGSLPTYLNNNFYNASGPATGVYSSGTCTYPAGSNGNISVDPQFVSNASSDYHLRPGSPDIDKGYADLKSLLAAYGVTFTTDADGKQRVQDATGNGCVVDMGALEYPGATQACSVDLTLQSSANPSVIGSTVTFTAQAVYPHATSSDRVQFLDGNALLATQPLSSAGVATFSTSQLTGGSHTIMAILQLAGGLTAANTTLTQVVSGYPTTTALSCSPATIPVGGMASFAIHVTSGSGTPAGNVVLTDNGNPLATPALSGGAAAYSYIGSAAGQHTITASYPATGTFSGSSATCTETVTALPSVATLTVNPSAAVYGSPVALRATVLPANPPGDGVPTGTVTFLSDGIAIGSAPVNASVASLGWLTAPGGNHNLTCSYGGSNVYAGSACTAVPLSVSAAATTLTLASSGNPSPALSPVTFTATLAYAGKPAGAGRQIALSVAGQTAVLTTDALGAVRYTTSTLLPGTYPVTAAFSGTANLLASSAMLRQTITIAPTLTALHISPNPAYVGQSVFMTATVATQNPSAPVTSGTLVFLDGTTNIATFTVPVTGTVTFNTPLLTVGSHVITAVYTATSSAYANSTSAAVTEVVMPAGFDIDVSPSMVTVPQQTDAVTTVQLTSQGNFAGPLKLTVGKLPVNASATIAPSSVSLTAGGSAGATLTIKTFQVPPAAASAAPYWRQPKALLAAFTLMLAPFGFQRRRRKVARLLLLAALSVTLQGITGCTNIYRPLSLVAPGTYTIPVTATGSNGVSQTATLTLTVTPLQVAAR